MHDFKYDPDRKREIFNLIDQGEGEKLDFKFAVNDARKIAKTLSAFANTKGGTLLIGVKDSGRVSGIDPEEEAHMISSAAEVYSDPKIPLSLHCHDFEGKWVLEVQVPESSEKPHLVKNRDEKSLAFFRFEDHTIPANGVLLKLWSLKQNPKVQTQLSFTSAEKAALKFLEKEGPKSFSQIKKVHKGSLIQITEFLAQLLAWSIVEITWSTEGYKYLINENPVKKTRD